MSDEQRRANGRRAKEKFAKDVTAELNRLDAEIKKQATSEYPVFVKITQGSVAKAVGYHRTTFKNHKSLVDRIIALKKQAKDPKKAHEIASVATISSDAEPTKVVQFSPRNKAIEEENIKLKVQVLEMRRELFLLKNPSLAARSVPKE
jgi:hypothetical protein